MQVDRNFFRRIAWIEIFMVFSMLVMIYECPGHVPTLFYCCAAYGIGFAAFTLGADEYYNRGVR